MLSSNYTQQTLTAAAAKQQQQEVPFQSQRQSNVLRHSVVTACKTPTKHVPQKKSIGGQIAQRENSSGSGVKQIFSGSKLSTSGQRNSNQSLYQSGNNQQSVLKDTYNQRSVTNLNMPMSYGQSNQKEFATSPTENITIDFPDVPTMLQITPQENINSGITSPKQKIAPSNQVMKQQARSSKDFVPKSRGKNLSHHQPSLNERNLSPSKKNIVTPFKQSIETFEQKMSIDHLKSAITALNEKLKLFENIEQEKDIVQEQFEQTDVARDELRNNIRETAERIKDEKDKNFKYQEILINENQSLSKQILLITEMFSKKVEELDSLTNQFHLHQKAGAESKLQFQNLSDYQQKYDREHISRDQLKDKFIKTNEVMEEKANEYKLRVKEITSEKKLIINENQDLKKQLCEADSEICDLKSQIDMMQNSLEDKEGDLEAEQLKVHHLGNIKQLYSAQVDEIESLKQERDKLNIQVSEFVRQSDAITKKMQEEFQRIEAERNNANQELNELFSEKSEKDVVIKTLTNENLELNSRMTALEQLLCAKEDQDAKYDSLFSAYQCLNETKDKYKNDLEVCTTYLLEVEEKCQEAQKTSLELLQQLKDRELEIEKMQEYIIELQKNAHLPIPSFVYTPVKDDPVDRKLAEYINKAPVLLRDQMRFERESEGIYKYGKKRVFIKIEKDHIIIRVGGGYLSIEEFIDQYCDGNTKEARKKLFGLVYGGNCKGSNDFKTFYLTQNTVKDQHQQQPQQQQVDTAGDDEQFEDGDCIEEQEEESTV